MSYPKIGKDYVSLPFNPQQDRIAGTDTYMSPHDGRTRDLEWHIKHRLAAYKRARQGTSAPRRAAPPQKSVSFIAPSKQSSAVWDFNTHVRRYDEAIARATAVGLTYTDDMRNETFLGSDAEIIQALKEETAWLHTARGEVLRQVKRTAQAAVAASAPAVAALVASGSIPSALDYIMADLPPDEALDDAPALSECAEPGCTRTVERTSDRLCFVCWHRFKD